MDIEDKSKDTGTQLHDLERGDCFKYDNNIYIMTDQGDSVNLENGEICSDFQGEWYILPLLAKLTVK